MKVPTGLRYHRTSASLGKRISQSGIILPAMSTRMKPNCMVFIFRFSEWMASHPGPGINFYQKPVSINKCTSKHGVRSNGYRSKPARLCCCKPDEHVSCNPQRHLYMQILSLTTLLHRILIKRTPQISIGNTVDGQNPALPIIRNIP